MITRLQLALWCDYSAKVEALKREYNNDYGRSYAVIDAEMKIAKAQLEQHEKEILSD